MPLPNPLTPPDLDLRDFDWMPLDVARLRDSDLSVLAPGDAFRAAVLLWCASWHQVPAASLPTEERLLANLAGYGRDLKGWAAVRIDALRGFVECSDGRLYHPVVAEKAIEAYGQRNKQRKRTEAATSARRGVKRNDQRDDRRNDTEYGERNDHHLTLPDQTEPYREGGKTPAPAKISRVNSKEGQTGTKITLDFVASDAARLTIRTMGFGDAQFDNEFSKFVQYYMARGYLRDDWDAALISWFQRAIPEPAPVSPTSPSAVMLNKVFVVYETLGWKSWVAHIKETRGITWSRTIERRDDESGRVQNGWWWPAEFAPGYDEATGERLSPPSEDAENLCA
jgi:hypothetical protein